MPSGILAHEQLPPPPKPEGRADGPGKPEALRGRGDGWHERKGEKGEGLEGGSRGDGLRRPPWIGKEGPDVERMKQFAMRELEKMSPEQRMEMWRATMAVMRLSPEKRKELLGLDEERMRKAKAEIEETLKAIGVELPEERRRDFFRRYFHERREIEETLRKEADERRPALVKEMHERLKAEFQPKPTPQGEKKPEPSAGNL